jgi:6-phosphofructokinase 1
VVFFIFYVKGDGSLTGASILSKEWVSHINSLLEKNKITQEEAKRYTELKIIGMVGSIDNDMYGYYKI